jgi:hypothetical protein
LAASARLDLLSISAPARYYDHKSMLDSRS